MLRNTITAAARKILPRGIYLHLKNLRDLAWYPGLRRAWYFGRRRYCVFCKGSFRKFLPSGLPLPVLKEKKVVGGGLRPDVLCPACRSLDRERLVRLYLDRRAAFLDRCRHILHVAPEKCLQAHLRSLPGCHYISADIQSPLAGLRLDVTRLPFAGGFFDMVVCSHVLEHVPDDRLAMKEIHRVLKPGGCAILQVPLAMALETTYENPEIMTPKGREEHFGQNDHVRLYAPADYRRRLESAGFRVNVYNFARDAGQAEARRLGINPEEDLYLVEKL